MKQMFFNFSNKKLLKVFRTDSAVGVLEKTKKQTSRVDFFDWAEFNGSAEKFIKTDEGYLMGRAVVTTVGVYPYLTADGSVIWELRHPEDVYDADSLKTLKMVPITDDHPSFAVTADNAKELSVGQAGENVSVDAYNGQITVPLKITDKEVVTKIENGKRGLSMGYNCDVEMVSGTWNGQPYDCRQRNIRYNHVAVVDRGRAGDDAILKMDICDAVLTKRDYKNIEKGEGVNVLMKKIKLDNGVEYEAEEKVIETLTSFKKRIDEVEAELAKANEAKAEIEAKVEALEAEKQTIVEEKSTIEAERDQLKEEKDNAAEAVSDEKIDSLIEEKLALRENARIAGVEIKDAEGNLKADMEIKKEIILKVSPKAKAKLEEKKDDVAYISSRYDAAVEALVDEKENLEDNLSKVNSDKADDNKEAPKSFKEAVREAWNKK